MTHSIFKNTAILWTNISPFSADPIQYDAFIHHLAFTSVLSPIVTLNKLGEYKGILAESWVVSSDFKEWTFRIRAGLQFENGDPITAHILVLSWLRLAFYQKSHHSQSGLLEFLEGFNEINCPYSEILGLKVSGNEITLTFIKPMPKVLEAISFGMYSVVHPSDFDRATGEWLDPHKVTASGAYRVSRWNADSFTLQLRQEFPVELRHKKALKEIEFVWEPGKRAAALSKKYPPLLS